MVKRTQFVGCYQRIIWVCFTILGGLSFKGLKSFNLLSGPKYASITMDILRATEVMGKEDITIFSTPDRLPPKKTKHTKTKQTKTKASSN